MRKALILGWLVFNGLAFWYLLSPTPRLPDLRDSAKSDEPGDTVQMANVSAYYTRLSRQEVMDFYKTFYRGVGRRVINHPPERAREIYRYTMQSYYLEELVLPFKESIYINGYEWANDVFTKADAREKNKMFFKGVEYPAKITIRVFPVSPLVRIVNFLVLEAGIFLMWWSYKKFRKLE